MQVVLVYLQPFPEMCIADKNRKKSLKCLILGFTFV